MNGYVRRFWQVCQAFFPPSLPDWVFLTGSSCSTSKKGGLINFANHVCDLLGCSKANLITNTHVNIFAPIHRLGNYLNASQLFIALFFPPERKEPNREKHVMT